MVRKLTMVSLITISTLSVAGTAAAATGADLERCLGGPALGAEVYSAATEPRPTAVPGMNVACLSGMEHGSYRMRDAFRRSSRDSGRFDRDDRDATSVSSSADTMDQTVTRDSTQDSRSIAQ